MRILDRRQQVIGQILAFGDEEGVFLGQAAGRAARVRIIGGAAVSRGVGRGFEGAREALEVCGEDFGEQAIEIQEVFADAGARHPDTLRQRDHGEVPAAEGGEGVDGGFEDEIPRALGGRGGFRAEAGNVLHDGADEAGWDVHGGILGTEREPVKSNRWRIVGVAEGGRRLAGAWRGGWAGRKVLWTHLASLPKGSGAAVVFLRAGGLRLGAAARRGFGAVAAAVWWRLGQGVCVAEFEMGRSWPMS